ncbi:MAG: hypothetical protein BroJett018_20540 [Chloroflexota bacterium]|nr:MAG: hypothetical protein BroJett018_20540 [Chloroflexota bacterium]
MKASVSLSKIGRCYRGEKVRAYIYIIYSKLQHAAYVGQTNDQNGALSRLCGHLGQNGTFGNRLLERQGIYTYEIEDLTMFTFCLPDEASYIGRESSYREGVEYLVQIQLRTIALTPFLHIVSQVRYNDTASLPFVKLMAKDVLDAFTEAYNN